MCLLTMANDGGLRAVLDTSDTVSCELLALGRAKNQRRCRDEDIHDLAMHTANVLEVNDDSVRSGTKRHASRSLSELSSDFSPKKMNLSLNTSQELKRVVTPLIEKMQSIDAAALLSLNPSSQSAGARLDEKGSLTVPPIHDRITPSYADDGSDIVRYLHVKEVPCKYSVGIFVFPPNTEIPLHDHPDMVVISRVLYGELKVRSYDVLSPGNDAPKDRSNEKPSTSNNGAKEEAAHGRQSVFTSSLKAIKDFVLSSYHGEEDNTHVETDSDASSRQNTGMDTNALHAKINQSPMGVEKLQIEDESVNILSAPRVTCLFPKEGNCHAFVAGSHGAAVLDILFPPYDGDDGRDCTFYQAKKALHEKSESTGDETVQEFHLTPIAQPDHFHCLSGVYGRFTSCDETTDKNDEESHILGIDVSVCTSS